MRTMVMSFKPDVYERIACGQKIFEHRRTFPDETIKVYMYVSKPICAVMGILLLGKRHSLQKWKQEFMEDREAVKRISDFMKSANYAMGNFGVYRNDKNFIGRSQRGKYRFCRTTDVLLHR